MPAVTPPSRNNPVRELSAAEIQQTVVSTNAIGNAAIIINSGSSQNKFTFVAAFDGTNNGRGDQNIAGRGLTETNISQLAGQVQDANKDNPDVKVGYYSGVGTGGINGGLLARSVSPTTAVFAAANQAYSDFQRQATSWLESNPGGDVSAAISGFSRGGGTAIVFAQILNERGLQDLNNPGTYLIQPGQVKVESMLLLDPVLTGINHVMTLPPNVLGNVVVVQAQDEFRYLFQGADLSNDGRVTTIGVYGNHGNIGGFYDNGIGALVLEGSTEFFRRSGIAINNVATDRQFDPTVPTKMYTEGTDTYGNRIFDEYGTRGNRLLNQIPAPLSSLGNDPKVQSINQFENPIAAGDSTKTIVISFRDGTFETRLVDASGKLLLVAGKNDSFSRDPVAGTYAVTSSGSNQVQAFDPISGSTTISAPRTATIVIDKNGTLTQLTVPENAILDTVMIGGELFSVAANGQPFRQISGNVLEIRDPNANQGTFVTLQPSGALNVLSGYIATERSDGVLATYIYDRNGTTVGVRERTSFDDGSSITNSTYSNGKSDSITLDSSGKIYQRSETATLSDGSLSNVTRNAIGAITSTSSKQLFDDGSSIETISPANGTTIRRVTEDDGVVTDTPVTNGYGNLLAAAGMTASFLSLAKAIESGKPLPIIASGINLATSINPSNTSLGAAGATVGAVTSLINLSQSIKNKDTFGAINYGAQAISYAATAYANAIGYSASQYGSAVSQAAANGAFGAASGAISSVSSAVPYISIIYSLSKGDTKSAAISAISLIPVVGQYIAIAYAIYSMMKEPPTPWGTGQFVWNADGSIGIQVSGANGGDVAVRNAMNSAKANLQGIVASYQSQSPEAQIALVATRLPRVTFNDGEFTLTDIDQVTGQDRSLHYTTAGQQRDAVIGTPEYFRTMNEQFVYGALSREAIAPQWEAETARIQSSFGNPKAGLTELQRAAQEGLLAGPKNPTATVETWRPIVLDLNGDGVQTISRQAANVDFETSSDGFIRSTGWVSAQDGMLVLDRNYNSLVDNGAELFSNGGVADAAKGLRSLSWVDANADFAISAADPVFDRLRVWQDLNGNGLADVNEVKTLAEVGVTSLNYGVGSFFRNGQVAQLASPTIEADAVGSKAQVVSNGILLTSSNGDVTLVVTKLEDLSSAAFGKDGSSGDEDNAQFISSEVLFLNDKVSSATALPLTLIGAGNAKHGAVIVMNGGVRFTPESNYFGTDASFTYTAQDQYGRQFMAEVAVTVNAINDAPMVVSDGYTQIPIYGYTVSGGAGVDDQTIPQIVTPFYVPGYGYDASGLNYLNRTTPIAFATDLYSGKLEVSDPDDTVFTFTKLHDGVKGQATVNADGSWSFVPGGVLSGSDAFEVEVTDGHGGTVTRLVTVSIPLVPGSESGTEGAPSETGSAEAGTGAEAGAEAGAGAEPIVLDLDKNGFSLISATTSQAFYDIKADGWRHRMGWTSGGDGLLAFDANSDGKIAGRDELSFVSYLQGAQSDLEGLAGFDTNVDGKISSLDSLWEQLKVWRDVNGNGESEIGEVMSLTDAGVASISLQSNRQFSVQNGNTILGVSQVTMTDGSFTQAADVKFSVSNDILVQNLDGTQEVVTQDVNYIALEQIGTSVSDTMAGTIGSDHILSGEGDDFVFDDKGNDVIEAGAGNDIVYSGADSDVVLSDFGNDTVFAGLGADLVLGADGDDALFGEGGDDIVFGGDGNDVIDGGEGADVLTGDQGEDTIYGQQGADAMFGGAGDDQLYGSSGNDRLQGDAGNDLLDGGNGIDDMAGGAGNDTYVVDQLTDGVIEVENEGIDTVTSAADRYELTANVENLILTESVGATGTLTALIGSGNTLANRVVGNSGNNTLYGNAGNDVLDGWTGADLMYGGRGNDTYIVDNVGDQVVEISVSDSLAQTGVYLNSDQLQQIGDGVDSVFSSVSFALGRNVENLTLTGLSAINATGNIQNNVLTGNDANNKLNGGLGIDIMTGGKGNDTYVVDNLGDQVIENAIEGIDSVESSVNYTLGATLENLHLLNGATLGEGNNLDNYIEADGTFAGQFLPGYGYISAERYGVHLFGFEGNDTLIGSIYADVLDGGAGNDVLNGGINDDPLFSGGSTPIETMIGGTGDDTYYVDTFSVYDVLIENANEGIDTVISSFSQWKLEANFENLVMSQSNGGVNAEGNNANNRITIASTNLNGSNISGYGGDDIIYGNVGSDVVFGGAGFDIIRTGGGNDTIFDSEGLSIVDAGSGDDLIYAYGDLTGGKGDDIFSVAGELQNKPNTYHFAMGDGHDQIFDGAIGEYAGWNQEYDLPTNKVDTIQFGIGVRPTDIRFERNQDNMIFRVGAADSIEIVHWFQRGGVSKIERFVFADGTVWDANYILLKMPELYQVTYEGGNNSSNLQGWSGIDRIQGGDGQDNIYSSAGDDRVSGGSGDDLINGGVGDDIINGDAGSDIIYGGAGNDQIDGGRNDDLIFDNTGENLIRGGSGNDQITGRGTISGGTGNDLIQISSSPSSVAGELTASIVEFGLGDGQDEVNIDAQGDGNPLPVTLKLGAGIITENVTLERQGSSANFLFKINGTSDQITFRGYVATGTPVLNNIVFADGTLWSSATITDRLYGNHAPTIGVPLSDAELEEGLAFTWQVPSGAFLDQDVGDVLTYGVTLASGQTKPAWLSIDTATGTLTGTAPLDASGQLALRIVATDSRGASVGSPLLLDVLNLIRGTTAANNLIGTSARDVIYGLAGNDTLDGGVGADKLIGAAGNDVYRVDNLGDVVVEVAGEGTDRVESSVTYSLSDNVENLSLTGAGVIDGTGNGLANIIKGNAGSNLLVGGAGNDTLDGLQGVDTLVGGLGNDVFTINDLDDLVVEALGEGIDRVDSTVSYVLTDNVENLTLLGINNIEGLGNALANILKGNSGNNLLTGGAGNDTLEGFLGTDTLVGGLGNDTYIVSDLIDTLVENANEGIDTVQASVTYTLGAEFENLTLIGGANIDGTGNALNNVLKGTVGNNRLVSGAGDDTLDGLAGADILVGGTGNDTYVITDTQDQIIENAGEGSDTVQASIDFTLSTELESLTLTGTAIFGSGNNVANTLVGNASANTLYGFEGNDKIDGKAGADTLIGGLGDDSYTVDNSSDVIVELVGEGTDGVSASVNYVLPINVENLTLTGIGLTGIGNAAANLLNGKLGSDDTLFGLTGNDTLRGFGGADTLVGGTGDDSYQLLTLGDAAQVVIVEAVGEGVDSVTVIEDYVFADHLENGTLASNATGNRLTGNSSDNLLTGNAAINVLVGGLGNDTLNGLAGADLLYGGNGNDTYVVDNIADAIGEDAANGIDFVQSSVTYALQDNVENLALTGTGTTNGFGNTAANILTGNTKNNVLFGFAGADVITGDLGNDTIDGGADNDLLFGGDGVDQIAGGTGNDQLTSGAGIDILLFNRGHGADTVVGTTVKEDVISLAGIYYADLSFSRLGNDLRLATGGTSSTDAITLGDWYTGQTSIAKLQVFTEGADYNAAGTKIVNKKIEQFDFSKLVLAFDTATVASGNLQQWQVTTASLTTAYLTSSDTTALGGGTTVDYARSGAFSIVPPNAIAPPPLNAAAPAGQIFGGL